MNGNLSIELAHQHQQELVEYASRSRQAVRPARAVRRDSNGWWRRWRTARSDASNVAISQLATASCTHR